MCVPVPPDGLFFFGHTHILLLMLLVILLFFLILIVILFVIVIFFVLAMFAMRGMAFAIGLRLAAPPGLGPLAPVLPVGGHLVLVGLRLPVDGLPDHGPEKPLVALQDGSLSVRRVGQHGLEQSSFFRPAQGRHVLRKICKHLHIPHIHFLLPLFYPRTAVSASDIPFILSQAVPRTRWTVAAVRSSEKLPFVKPRKKHGRPCFAVFFYMVQCISQEAQLGASGNWAGS